MAIAVRAVGAAAGSTSTAATSLTLTAPSTVQPGDYLVAFFRSQASGSSVDATPPSGWTLISTPRAQSGQNASSTRITNMMGHLAAAGDPTTWTLTFPAGGRQVGFIAAFTGVDPTTPVAAARASAFTGATDATSLSVPAWAAAAGKWVLEHWAAEYRANGGSHALTSYTGELALLGEGFAPAPLMGLEDQAVARTATRGWAGYAPAAGAPAHVINTSGTQVTSSSWQVALNDKPGPAGAAATTGAGTLSASGSPSTTGLAAMTGAGTLSTAGVSAETGLAAMSGVGTLSSTGRPTVVAQLAQCSATVPGALRGGWWLDPIPAGAVVRAVASTSSDFNNPTRSEPLAPATGSGGVTGQVTGLAEGTAYHVGLEVDGVVLPTGRARVRTSAPARAAKTTVVAVGSCNVTGSNHVVFDRIRADDPDFFAHMGDRHYADTSVETTWRAAMKSSMTTARQTALAAAVPITWDPDNHDWGGNRSWRDSPVGAFAGTVMRETTGDYAHPKGFYRTWVHRGVQFVHIDRWTFRDKDTAGTSTDGDASAAKDPADTTKIMLGATQEAWLLDILTNSTATAIVVFTGFPLTAIRFGPYLAETGRIRDAILALPATQRRKIIGVGGDSHDIRANSGTAKSVWRVPTLNASPLEQSGGAFDTDGWDIGIVNPVETGRGYYNRLSIVDDLTAMTVRWEAVRDDGVTQMSWERRFPEETTAATAAYTGAGSLTASASPSTAGVATPTGAGSLTAAATPRTTGVATTTGSGTLTAITMPSTAGTAARTGTGTLLAATTPATAGTAQATGVGVLSTGTSASTSGVAVNTGSGSLTTTPAAGSTGTAPHAGTGTLSASAAPTIRTGANYVGAGDLEVSTARVSSSGAANLSGVGELTTTARPTGIGSAATTGDGILSTVTTLRTAAAAPLAGTGTLTTSGAADVERLVAFTGSGTLTAQVLAQLAGLASTLGSGMLLAAGTVTITPPQPRSSPPARTRLISAEDRARLVTHERRVLHVNAS